MPEELHPSRSSHLQRSINKCLQSPLTVPGRRGEYKSAPAGAETSQPPGWQQEPRPRRARQPTDLRWPAPAVEWPASPVYRSREIGPSLTIDFVPLPATAALDNSHHMDFSLNPKLISAVGGIHRYWMWPSLLAPRARGLEATWHVAAPAGPRATAGPLLCSGQQAEGMEAALPAYPPTRQASKSLCTQECPLRTLINLRRLQERQGKSHRFASTGFQFTASSTSNLLCDLGKLLNLSVPLFQ